MIPAGTETTPGAEASANETPSYGRRGAPLAPTIALTLTLALALFVVVLAAVMLASSSEPVPGTDSTQDQQAESALYLISFALILPLALVFVPRLADRIAAGPNSAALSALGGLLAATFAAAILITRVLPGGGGVVEAVAVVGVWWLGAIAVLASAAEARPRPRLLQTERLAPYAWAVVAGLVVIALLAFTHLSSLSEAPLVLGAVGIPVALLIYARRSEVPHLPRARRSAAGGLVDAAVIVVLVWAIPNLVIFTVGPLGSFNPGVAQFHHDLWLGPVNEMLAGRPLLVDTAAQYGIAPIYLLAGWFELVPIGYGMLGFLDGLLFALLFAAAYCLLRFAGASRSFAAVAIAFGVVVLGYNLEFPVGFLPQHGPLRFGLPLLLIVVATARARWPEHWVAAWRVQLALVGLSSIWALEAFGCTVFAFAAILCFEAWTLPRPGRLAWVARRTALALGACVVAHVIFTIATLAFTGEIPDYGWYLGFLNEFLFGELADISYDFSPWSAGLLVGAGYAASAAAFVLVLRKRPDVVAGQRPALVAICGSTAYGIALFTYAVERSSDHVIPYVAVPLLIAVSLWLCLLLRPTLVGSRPLRLGALAFGLSVATLLVSVAWSSISERVEQSPLGYAFPGGDSLSAGFDQLWDPAPLDPSAPAGEALLERYMPDASRVLIMVSPDLATEILVRSGRANQLAFSYPLEDSFVPSRLLPALERTVDEIEPGQRMLMQPQGLRAFRAIERQPGRDVLQQPVENSDLIREQQWALQRIAERFGLRPIHRDPDGFVVVELVPRG